MSNSLSAAKAALLSLLSDEMADKLVTILEDGQVYEFPRPEEPAKVLPQPYTAGRPENVLVIGDLHAPFIREGYLDFCREQQEKLQCGTVVFIGDIVDQHAISYHESDPDGLSAGEEYKQAMQCLKDVFAMFPTAYCTLGNHDLLVARKAKTAGLSAHFVRSLSEIYKAPNTWQFVDEVELYGVNYTHGGAGGNAARVAMHSRQNTVQGHRHSEFSVNWMVSSRDAIFGMQAGSGVDDKAYAFAYGRPFPKKSAIGCSAVLSAGKIPVNLLMPL